MNNSYQIIIQARIDSAKRDPEIPSSFKRGHLVIKKIRTVGTTDSSLWGHSSPYVKLRLNDSVFQTRPMSGAGGFAEWDTDFSCTVSARDVLAGSFQAEALQKAFSDASIGSAVIKLSRAGAYIGQEVQLSGEVMKGPKKAGRLVLVVQLDSLPEEIETAIDLPKNFVGTIDICSITASNVSSKSLLSSKCEVFVRASLPPFQEHTPNAVLTSNTTWSDMHISTGVNRLTLESDRISFEVISKSDSKVLGKGYLELKAICSKDSLGHMGGYFVPLAMDSGEANGLLAVQMQLREGLDKSEADTPVVVAADAKLVGKGVLVVKSLRAFELQSPPNWLSKDKTTKVAASLSFDDTRVGRTEFTTSGWPDVTWGEITGMEIPTSEAQLKYRLLEVVVSDEKGAVIGKGSVSITQLGVKPTKEQVVIVKLRSDDNKQVPVGKVEVVACVREVVAVTLAKNPVMGFLEISKMKLSKLSIPSTVIDTLTSALDNKKNAKERNLFLETSLGDWRAQTSVTKGPPDRDTDAWTDLIHSKQLADLELERSPLKISLIAQTVNAQKTVSNTIIGSAIVALSELLAEFGEEKIVYGNLMSSSGASVGKVTVTAAFVDKMSAMKPMAGDGDEEVLPEQQQPKKTFVQTTLTKEAKKGDSKLEVKSHDGFVKGMRLEIGQGNLTETAVLKDIGSLVLESGVANTHAEGTVVKGYMIENAAKGFHRDMDEKKNVVHVVQTATRTETDEADCGAKIHEAKALPLPTLDMSSVIITAVSADPDDEELPTYDKVDLDPILEMPDTALAKGTPDMKHKLAVSMSIPTVPSNSRREGESECNSSDEDYNSCEEDEVEATRRAHAETEKKIATLILNNNITHDGPIDRTSLIYNEFKGNVARKLTKGRFLEGLKMCRLKVCRKHADMLWTRLDPVYKGECDLESFKTVFGNLEESVQIEEVRQLRSSPSVKNFAKHLKLLCDNMRSATFTLEELYDSYDATGRGEMSVSIFSHMLKLLIGHTVDRKDIYTALSLMETGGSKSFSKEELKIFVYFVWRAELAELLLQQSSLNEYRDQSRIQKIIQERNVIKAAVRFNFRKEWIDSLSTKDGIILKFERSKQKHIQGPLTAILHVVGILGNTPHSSQLAQSSSVSLFSFIDTIEPPQQPVAPSSPLKEMPLRNTRRSHDSSIVADVTDGMHSPSASQPRSPHRFNETLEEHGVSQVHKYKIKSDIAVRKKLELQQAQRQDIELNSESRVRGLVSNRNKSHEITTVSSLEFVRNTTGLSVSGGAMLSKSVGER